MIMEGVDYSYTRPSPAGLYAAGKRFAVRYVGTPLSGKNLTAVEAQALIRAGLAIACTYETSAGFMTTADGAVAARRAYNDARACGMPAGRPIYFALDVDPATLTASQRAGVERFLAAACDDIGYEHVGVYAGLGGIEWLLPKFARWGWQTYAWSKGVWSPKRHLDQYKNGVSLAGGTVDLCRSVTADFGQWGQGPEEDDMTPEQEAKLDAALAAVKDTPRLVWAFKIDDFATAGGSAADWSRRTKVAAESANAKAAQLLARDPVVDVDEAALAAELAPLLAQNTRSLSDTDLELVGKAVLDEQHRRTAE